MIPRIVSSQLIALSVAGRGREPAGSQGGGGGPSTALKRSLLEADATRVTARVRQQGWWVLLACAGMAATAWLGLYGFGWNDYDTEARAAVDALVQGHLGSFFSLAPIYGGSLLERAPFALVPGLWGGGDLAIYRMLALPCLLAGGALGLWLTAHMRSRGAGALSRAVALGLCVANPLTLAALEIGHPEELLGGVLCVAAVLLAARGRGLWAGLALGLAIANKQWAVLAVAPVLVALPARRLLCLGAAGAVAAALLAPFPLLAAGAFSANAHAAASPDSTIFQPWQAWWFFGQHGHVVRGLFGAIKPGYRTAPAWIGGLPHLLIPALAVPLSAPVLWRSLKRDGANEGARERDALLLLALLLLLRCLLDTWDVIYYPLPFVLALLAWEATTTRRPPVLALSSAVTVWAACRWLPSFASADAQSSFFLALSVPLAAWLALRLYAPRALSLRRRRALSAHPAGLAPLARPAESLPLATARAAAATRPA